MFGSSVESDRSGRHKSKIEFNGAGAMLIYLCIK
jgi:hypothetical protein